MSQWRGAAGYSWDESWAALPSDDVARYGWAHHGIGMTADGRLVGTHLGDGRICIFGADGALLARWSSGLVEAHGMAISGPADAERLWLTDTGTAVIPSWTPGIRPVDERELDFDWPWPGYALHAPNGLDVIGQVVQFDLEGRRLGALPAPPPPPIDVAPHQLALGKFAPTDVVVQTSADGREAIWVADGYGQGLVHRYSAAGEHELTISGEEGAGRFHTPHGLLIDRRRSEPRLYVADFANARLQVFSLDGEFTGAVEENLLHPSSLATVGDHLLIADLHARLTVLDADDRLVEHVGWDERALERPGWPNAVHDRITARPSGLRSGRFNSPHAVAVDAAGDIHIAEWVIGGRLVRLRQRRRSGKDGDDSQRP